MVDFQVLVGMLSIPRPNGSAAERKTCDGLCGWLSERGIPYKIHRFRALPYFFESIGLWLILSRSLLVAAVWLRWGWPALAIALIGLLGGTLDVAFGIPLVSWPGARIARNILIEFKPTSEVAYGASPADETLRETVISAHYDTKTELLDHRRRMFLLKSLRAGIFATVLLGILGPLDHALLAAGSAWANVTFGLGIVLGLPLLALAWALGINLSTGRLLEPSCGTVDNGAACAILLALADRLQSGQLALARTAVTIALFTGEEVNMQGSRAYLRDRGYRLPEVAVNLEVMAQDGPYVLWDQDGTVFHLEATDGSLNAGLNRAICEITGEPAVSGGPITSDGASFVHAGIPTTVLGTYHTRWIDGGFHCSSDNPDRIRMDRLPEGVEILARFLQDFDKTGS